MTALATPLSQAVRNRPTLRKPVVDDGAAIHRLVDACKPLDCNSAYAYLLLAHHFSGTCVVAEAGDELVGFVSAYRPPAQQETVFVWQVAVSPSARGQGLAKTMLRELLRRDELTGINYLETTISPSNEASQRVFRGLARELGCDCTQQALFDQRHFGGAQHEAENLFRLGPFLS